MMTRQILKYMMKHTAEGQLTPVQMMEESAKTRKDVWPSREAAHEWFKKRYPWKKWDPRSLELFIVSGQSVCV